MKREAPALHHPISGNEVPLLGELALVRYVKRKIPALHSKAAAEITRLLASQEPPLDFKQAAVLAGVHPETMRVVVNDRRIPTSNVINGIALALGLSRREIEHLRALSAEDRLAAKLEKVSQDSGAPDPTQFADIYSHLTEDQKQALLKSALRLAKKNVH